MNNHLIFYDGECPFCNRAVRHFIGIDLQKKFLFAPLKGETADQILVGPKAALKNANSLVLVENYQSADKKFWIESRAILRIYWLVGGWRWIGIFSFFPSFFGDFIYRTFAKHRYRFKVKMPEKSEFSDRLLP